MSVILRDTFQTSELFVPSCPILGRGTLGTNTSVAASRRRGSRRGLLGEPVAVTPIVFEVAHLH